MPEFDELLREISSLTSDGRAADARQWGTAVAFSDAAELISTLLRVYEDRYHEMGLTQVFQEDDEYFHRGEAQAFAGSVVGSHVRDVGLRTGIMLGLLPGPDLLVYAAHLLVHDALPTAREVVWEHEQTVALRSGQVQPAIRDAVTGLEGSFGAFARRIRDIVAGA